jgi:hypothetical protein
MNRVGQDFANTYSLMPDEDLLRIKADQDTLVWEAREALERELHKRRINILSDPNDPEELSKTLEGAKQSHRHREILELLSKQPVSLGRIILGVALGMLLYRILDGFILGFVLGLIKGNRQ